MKILFLHGWQSTPGGAKPTYLAQHGHEVLNPTLPDDDFDAAVRIAQAEFDRGTPDVVVGSSRGGAVAMNIDSGDTPLVLLCPAWKRWGTATTVKSNTLVFLLHSPADETIPIADSQELIRNSDRSESELIVVGTDHRLADPDSLAAMLEVVEFAGSRTSPTACVNLAPEPIVKAALMTLGWAMVLCRNWTHRSDVPVKMVNDLMEAIHAVPEILLYWNEESSFEMLLLHLSCFDAQSWKVQVDGDRFPVSNLAECFRDWLKTFGGDEPSQKD